MKRAQVAPEKAIEYFVLILIIAVAVPYLGMLQNSAKSAQDNIINEEVRVIDAQKQLAFIMNYPVEHEGVSIRWIDHVMIDYYEFIDGDTNFESLEHSFLEQLGEHNRYRLTITTDRGALGAYRTIARLEQDEFRPTKIIEVATVQVPVPNGETLRLQVEESRDE